MNLLTNALLYSSGGFSESNIVFTNGVEEQFSPPRINLQFAAPDRVEFFGGRLLRLVTL